MFHVVMPFMRPENIAALRDHLRPFGVQWHPLCQTDWNFGEPEWIKPVLIKVPNGWDPCYYKLNAFKDIVDEDYYHFLCDDDHVAQGFYSKLARHCGEALVCEAAMPRPLCPAKPEWMRPGACTLSQLILRGDRYKKEIFTNEPVADGRMLESIASRNLCEYVPEARVLHNRLQAGLWKSDDPAMTRDEIKEEMAERLRCLKMEGQLVGV